MKKILLVIPAYNEEENIGGLLEQLKASEYYAMLDVLVIDDCSGDRTAQIVADLGIKVISQIFNMGYGAALQTAYKYAVQKGYAYVIQMDADGQHDLKNIPRLCERLGACSEEAEGHPDIVIGSRFLKGSESFPMSGLKMFSIRMFRRIIRMVGKVRLTDPTSGLQGLNRRAFSYYAEYGNFDLKYPDMNMIIQMLLLGYRIEEVPAIMHERVAGVSMHKGLWKVGRYMILMVLSTFTAWARYGKKKK